MTRRRFTMAGVVVVGAVILASVRGVAPANPVNSPVNSSAISSVNSPAAPLVSLTHLATVDQPIGVVSRPDDPLMYVIEKTGRLKTLASNGSLLTILDLTKKVSTQNERGLLAVAFPPSDRSKLYVSYTDLVGALTVAEFPFPGPLVDPSTERILLQIKHPNDDHNGGSLAFDANGLLYIGVGDGGGVGTKGGVGDRDNNAQNLNVLLGKILRIDPRKSGDSDYQIPAGNPFSKPSSLNPTSSKRRPEIFAFGLRNPWRIRIDGTFLFIADVGQSSWEEVNRISLDQAGANFGWRLREGKHPYRGGGKPSGAIEPIFEYAHTDGRCAVIGGTVVEGTAVEGTVAGGNGAGGNGAGNAVAGSRLAGGYVFGDLCSGRFMQLRQTNGSWSMIELGVRLAYLTSINSGPNDSLIATSLNGGVYRLDPPG